MAKYYEDERIKIIKLKYCTYLLNTDCDYADYFFSIFKILFFLMNNINSFLEVSIYLIKVSKLISKLFSQCY